MIYTGIQNYFRLVKFNRRYRYFLLFLEERKRDRIGFSGLVLDNDLADAFVPVVCVHIEDQFSAFKGPGSQVMDP